MLVQVVALGAMALHWRAHESMFWDAVQAMASSILGTGDSSLRTEVDEARQQLQDIQHQLTKAQAER